MSWIGRALSSVSQYYKEINPATLSGAIDVIVVESRDDKTGEVTLACSPFHVRYGKLSVLRPVDRKVYIKINGEEAPFHMKVGDTGEAFFVFQTEQDVPDHLLTSPLAGPVSDDDIPPDDDAGGPDSEVAELDLSNDPEPLDLGDSVATLPGPSPASSLSLYKNDQDLSDAADTSAAPLSDAEREAFTHSYESSSASNTNAVLHAASKGAQLVGGLVKDIADGQDRLEKLGSGIAGIRGAGARLASFGSGTNQDNDDENATGSVLEKVEGKTRNVISGNPSDRSNAITEEAFLAGEYEGLPSLASSGDIVSFGRQRSMSDGGPNDRNELGTDRITGNPGVEVSPFSGLHDISAEDLDSTQLRQNSVQGFGRDKRSVQSASQAYEEHSHWKGGSESERRSSQMPPLRRTETHIPAAKRENLMLDMDGYKSHDVHDDDATPAVHGEHGSKADNLDEEAFASGIKTPPLEELRKLALLDEEEAKQGALVGNSDVLALTRALLRYSEAEVLVGSTSVKRANLLAEDNSAVAAGLNKDSATSDIDLDSAAADPYVFVMLSEGSYHLFEISIVPPSSAASATSARTHSRLVDDPAELVSNISSAQPSQEEFTKHRLTNESFLSRPEQLEDRHLYVRYRGKIFGWEDDGAPALASLAIYRKALIDKRPELQTPGLSADHDKDLDNATIKPEEAPRRGGWKRWWSGTTVSYTASRSRTTTDGSIPLEGPEAQHASLDAPPLVSHRSTSSLAVDGKKEEGEHQAQAASTDPRECVPPTSSISPPISPPPSMPSSPGHPEFQNETAQATQYAKTLRLTSDQLKQLNLKKGRNDMSFTVQSSFSSGVVVITSRIFLWEQDFQVVISDIDGTITKSDALGHVFTMMGRDWTHPGVAKLYTDIARNGYKLLYLTSRAIGQADLTREYLRGIQQGSYTLPEGPVIMSPDRLLTSLHREVVLRKPEVFKMACLRDIKGLFVDRNPFYSGFGNRLTDGLSYRSVEIPSSRIFTIDSSGNVKLELLELAGYISSYIAMTNLVDETFPPIFYHDYSQSSHNRTGAAASEGGRNRHGYGGYGRGTGQTQFNDFNYWKPTLPSVELPDMSTLLPPVPVSPALSARSESSSRMSVFRVGAIAGVITKRASRSQLRTTMSAEDSQDLEKGKPRNGTVSPRSSSPTPLDSIYDSDGEVEEESSGAAVSQDKGRKPASDDVRRRTDSMPGSFEDESYLERMREEELEREASEGRHLEEGNDEEEVGDEDEEDEDADDDIPEMDFGNVPYL